MTINGHRVEWETIGELLDTRGRDQRDKLAMEICGREVTYGELLAEVDRVAANLYRMGIRKGDHVASFLPNSMEQILVWFGTVKIGAVWLPLNIALIGNDLAYSIQDANPKILVVAAELRQRVEDLALTLPIFKVLVGADHTGYEPFGSLLAECEAPPRIDIGPADPAVICYTGGTTGMPKGVILPHFAWIAAGYRYKETFQVRPDDRHFSIFTLFHNAGLQLGVLGPILCNIPTTIEPRFSLSSYWKRVRETRSTIIDMIGTVMMLLSEAPPCANDKENSVRVCLAPVFQLPDHIPGDFAKRFGISLINVYSLSEGGGTVIIHNVPDSRKPLSNGNGCGWADMMIVDERDFPVPAGTVGQICLRPRVPHIFMAGYLNNPKKTIETWSNLWLHTGDFGYLDTDGDLYFTGRQVHSIRRRGENVSAYEVETLISKFPGVKEAVAVGVPAELGEEEIKLFIVADADATIDPKAVVAWCRPQIAAFKIPRFIEVIESFPRSATKFEIERHKLKAMPNDRAWDAEKAKH